MERINLILAALIVVVGGAFVAREFILARRQERQEERHSAEFKALMQRITSEPHMVLNQSSNPGLFDAGAYYAHLRMDVREWCRDYLQNGSDIKSWFDESPSVREMNYCLFFANEDEKFAFQMRWGGCVNTSPESGRSISRVSITYSSTRSQDRVIRSFTTG